MKTELQSKKRSWLDQLDHIRHFSAKSTEPLKPMKEKDGIHCVGEQYGYIVDWQIDEKKTLNRNQF